MQEKVGTNLKTFDPFSGYRLAYGNSMLHLGYFIAIWLIPVEKDTHCTKADFTTARIALLVAHIVVSFFQIFGYFLTIVFDYGLIGKVLDTMCLFLYQGAIFYT